METEITDNLSIFYTDSYESLMGFGVIVHTDGDLCYIYDIYNDMHVAIPKSNVYPCILKTKYSSN